MVTRADIGLRQLSKIFTKQLHTNSGLALLGVRTVVESVIVGLNRDCQRRFEEYHVHILMMT